ncbi:hypothetical protein C8T65DRAFT_730557 [Cerioporus squamosus]|nr:hypothetical protein C8T65DRAFT_730557 [Cerioporus squamosus]
MGTLIPPGTSSLDCRGSRATCARSDPTPPPTKPCSPAITSLPDPFPLADPLRLRDALPASMLLGPLGHREDRLSAIADHLYELELELLRGVERRTSGFPSRLSEDILEHDGCQVIVIAGPCEGHARSVSTRRARSSVRRRLNQVYLQTKVPPCSRLRVSGSLAFCTSVFHEVRTRVGSVRGGYPSFADYTDGRSVAP